MMWWWTIEGEFNGRGNGWTDWSADVMAEELTARYGVLGTRPTDLVAGAGMLSFALDNSTGNSAGILGYYSPAHARCRPGFATGIGVRLSVQVPGYPRHYKWVGTIEAITPIAGVYGRRITEVTCTDWIDYASRTKVNALGVQLEKRSDQLFALLVSSVPIQPRAVQVGTAVDVYPFAFDNLEDESRTVLTEMARLAKSEGGRIYLRGDNVQGGTLVFEPRAARVVSQSNVDTFPDTELTGLDAPRSRAQIINRALAVTNQRRLGATNTEVLYDSTSRIGVDIGQLKLFAPYRDPTMEVERISAVDVQTPTAAAGDISATVNEDGTGGDVTGSITITAGDEGNGAHVLITNAGSGKAWVWFRIRGRPLVTYRTTVAEAEDADSILNQGESAVTMEMPYQSDPAVALQVARHTIRMFGQPTAAPVIQFLIGGDEPALADRVLRREVGDRVGISEEVTGIGARGYFINAIDLTLREGVALAVSWTLQPADQGNYWRNNLQGAGNVSLMIVAPGNLIGHSDIAHADGTHVDVAHADIIHADTAGHGDSHSDFAHGDHVDAAAPHQDAPHIDDAHDDVAHGDTPHADASTPHYDRAHLDDAHYDAHGDTPHNDQPHADSHGDVGHQDHTHADHQDIIHDDAILPPTQHVDHFDTGIPPGFHQDSVHVDTAHGDDAHQDSGPHVDSAFGDVHGDFAHGDDTHEDVPAAHGDTPFTDVAFQDDPHDDTAHVDHSDTAHIDSLHQDTHADSAAHTDTPHSDYPHVDVAHTDTPHLDEG